jgi:parvulin-like peptidyl-prolyl isomerase
MIDPSRVIVSVPGVSLSLADCLAFAKRRGRLLSLLREALLDRLIVERAGSAGLKVADAELQAAADAFRHRQGLTSAAATQASLVRQNLTVEDLERSLEADLLAKKLKDHVTRDHIPEHFAAHKGRYARAQLRQIVVGSEEVARELLAQITDEGRNFAELAREHSAHGPSRATGGSLGLVPRYALPAAAAEAIFAARAGSVVGPIASDQGFHLFLVESLPEPALDDTTAAMVRHELFDAWLRGQLKDMRIDLSWLESS